MAVVSLDTVFKDELSTIESWFRVLSEAERTAALYSLLQHSSQVQIRFFITVLQQMAKKDPVGALLSPSSADKGKEIGSFPHSPLPPLSRPSPYASPVGEFPGMPVVLVNSQMKILAHHMFSTNGST